MNNSVRGLFRYTIVVSILTLFFLLSISIHYVPVFAQTSEEVWNSFTLQRVNLRETPSIRSTILTVFDEGTVVTVIDEVPQWMLIATSENDTGWIFSDYVVPNASLSRLPDVTSVLHQSGTMQTVTVQSAPQDEGPEFTRDREPEYINLEDSEGDGSAGASGFFIFLFVLSLTGNAALGYWLWTLRKTSSILSEPSTFQDEFQLLKKENIDLKNQLQYAQVTVSKSNKSVERKEKDLQVHRDLHIQEMSDIKTKLVSLESTHNQSALSLKGKDEQIENLTKKNIELQREIESVHKKLNQSSDNIKHQALKYTLENKTHTETLFEKEKVIHNQKLKLEESDKARTKAIKEILEKTDALQSDNQSLNQKIGILEKEIAEKEKSFLSKIEKERSTAKAAFEKQLHERIEREKADMENHYKSTIDTINDKVRSTQNSLINQMKQLQEKLSITETQLAEERKQREELEIQGTAPVQEKAILEDLQNEYNALLNVYEESQQNLKSSETEKQDMPVQEQNPAQKTIEHESLPITQQEKPPVQSSETPDKSPVLESKPVVKQNADDNLDAYARSFFKKISKIS